MKAYQISQDCLCIDINSDEAQELIGREGSIPTDEWGAIRPSIQAFARSYRIAAAYQLIEKQRVRIQELETQIRDLETAALLLPVEGETS